MTTQVKVGKGGIDNIPYIRQLIRPCLSPFSWSYPKLFMLLIRQIRVDSSLESLNQNASFHSRANQFIANAVLNCDNTCIRLGRKIESGHIHPAHGLFS